MIPKWDHNGSLVKVVGLDLLAAFLRRNTVVADGERVRSWLSDVKARQWGTLGELLADYGAADVSAVPTVSFLLGVGGPTIRTLIDFRPKVVLVTEIMSGAEMMTR